MLYYMTFATWADTSSNQASKDPGQLGRGYSNLDKIYYINTIPSSGETLPGASKGILA